MGIKETLALVIEADSRGAVKAVEDVGKSTEKHLGKSQKTIDQWGKGLSRAGVGMVGLGAVALAGLGGLAKQSEEANKASLQLQNSLKNNPRLAGTSAKSFEELATAIQSKTAADADDITAGIAVLAQGRLQAQQIRTLTPLVVDLARKKGMDEVAAFTLASKAVAGNAGALKRAGIQVDETKFKTDAYGATVEALRGSVGGFATAEGATFSGSLARMRAQLGDLGESVGSGAVDAFTKFFGVVGSGAAQLEKISPGAQHAAGEVAAFGAAGLIAVGGLSTLVGKAIEARENFSKLGTGLSSMSGKLGGLSTIGPLTLVATALSLGVIEARKLNAEANKLNVNRAVAQLNSLSEAGRRAGRETVKTSLAFNHGERDVKSLAESSVPAARNFVKMAKALGAPEPLIRKLNKAIEDQKQADVGAAQAQRKYSDEVDNASGALDKNADSTRTATDALQDYEDRLHSLLDPLFGMQDALVDNAQAQADVQTKTLELAAAQAEYDKALKQHGPHSKEAAAASLEMMGAQQALDDANRQVTRSALGVDGAIADLRAEIEKNPGAVDQAKRHLAAWVQQGLITAGQAKKTGDEFDRLAGKVRRTPSTKKISVFALGGDRAQDNIQAVKDALDRLHDKTVHLSVMTLGGDRAQELARRAGGGPVSAGKAYMVGEKGPELFLPNQSGAIVPNRQLVSGPTMGGLGGPNITINVSMAGALVPNAPAAKRWVAEAWNDAAANRMVHVRGRPL